MNYLQRHKKRHTRKRRLVGVVLAIVAGVLFAGYFLFPSPVTSAVHTLGTPLWYVRDWVSTGGGVQSYFQSKTELQQENQELEEKLRDAELRLKQFNIVISENRDFRHMWNRASTTEGVLAEVRVSPPQSPYDMVVLDVGTTNTVEVGDHVVRAGALLGEITSVYSRTAVARLYSTTGVTSSGVIDARNITVELTGDGGGAFTATAPKDVAIEPGMIIIVPGVPAYLVAEVVDVEARPADPFQILRARSPVNVSQLRRVRVIDAPQDVL